MLVAWTARVQGSQQRGARRLGEQLLAAAAAVVRLPPPGEGRGPRAEVGRLWGELGPPVVPLYQLWGRRW